MPTIALIVPETSAGEAFIELFMEVGIRNVVVVRLGQRHRIPTQFNEIAVAILNLGT